jgi:hypothetical protein
LGSANEQAEYTTDHFSTKYLKDWWLHSSTELLEGPAGTLLILVDSLCTTSINFRFSQLTLFISVTNLTFLHL